MRLWLEDQCRFSSVLTFFLPEARLGLWVLSLPVSMCVYQSRARPHDNSSLFEARIIKFGPEVQNIMVKIPIVLIDFNLQSHFPFWKLFFFTYLRSFCIIFSEIRRFRIFVRPSLAIGGISLGFWLNISFVVNYRWTFWLIINIAVVFLTSEDRYFLWFTARPLSRWCLQSQQHSG